ncbi:MAG: hypothetical protein RR053_07530, partial [Evtepia sp.]
NKATDKVSLSVAGNINFHGKRARNIRLQMQPHFCLFTHCIPARVRRIPQDTAIAPNNTIKGCPVVQ